MKIGQYIFREPHFKKELIGEIYYKQKDKEHIFSFRFKKHDLIDFLYMNRKSLYLRDYSYPGDSSTYEGKIDWKTPLYFIRRKYYDLLDSYNIINWDLWNRKSVQIDLCMSVKNFIRMINGCTMKELGGMHLYINHESHNRYFKEKFIITSPDNLMVEML